MWYGDFRNIADTANFIIVHPQGLLDNTGLTNWNIGQSSVDDIGFIELLHQKLSLEYSIDLNKVFNFLFSELEECLSLNLILNTAFADPGITLSA